MSFKLVSFLHLYLLFYYILYYACTNRVIADFVSNFVVMTTMIAPLKI